MYSSTLLTLLAALPLAFTSPTNLNPRQNGLTCQTTTGSPITLDVGLAVHELRDRGGRCRQSNGEGSGMSPSSPLDTTIHHHP